jgi:predicted nuclease of restriction endonuclease-like (RecB) superfamily
MVMKKENDNLPIAAKEQKIETPTNNITTFEEIIYIIERARENSFRAVNRELIAMYWEIGHYISTKAIYDNWGKSIVLEFSNFIQNRFIGIKGFSPQNIWRMKQFYETYCKNEKLSPLVREITWTNNVLIMMAAKTDEEREFYLLLSAKNNYSKGIACRKIARTARISRSSRIRRQ